MQTLRMADPLRKSAMAQDWWTPAVAPGSWRAGSMATRRRPAVVPTLGHAAVLTRDNGSSNTRPAETLPDPTPRAKK